MDESIKAKIDKIVDTGKMLADLGVSDGSGKPTGEGLTVEQTNRQIVNDLLHNKNKGMLCFLTVAGLTPKEMGVVIDEAEPPMEVVIERFDRVRAIVLNTIDEISTSPAVTKFNNDLYELFKNHLSDIRSDLQEDYYQRFREDENSCIMLKISILHHDEFIVGISLEHCASHDSKRIPLFEYGYHL